LFAKQPECAVAELFDVIVVDTDTPDARTDMRTSEFLLDAGDDDYDDDADGNGNGGNSGGDGNVGGGGGRDPVTVALAGVLGDDQKLRDCAWRRDYVCVCLMLYVFCYASWTVCVRSQPLYCTRRTKFAVRAQD
jgi:hypothetical protein